MGALMSSDLSSLHVGLKYNIPMLAILFRSLGVSMINFNRIYALAY